MVQGTLGVAWSTLTEFLEAFESALTGQGQANLADFIPDRRHPLYLPVLRELVRIDLEWSWERRQPRSLAEYQDRFPDLFADASSVQAIAFEEYRLRLQAGETPDPHDYARRFQVQTDDWPTQLSVAGESSCASNPGSSGSHSNSHQEPRTSRQGYQDFLREVRGCDPGAAQRFAQAFDHMPEPGHRFIGFRLLTLLGEGAFGRVFLAEQPDLGQRQVVLKISPDLHGETRMLAQLQHTNIVPVYSSHRATPFQALCMPWFGATTLADMLRALRQRVELPRTGAELLEVLQSAKHRHGKQELALPREISSTRIHDELRRRSYVDAVLWLGARLADGLAHAHERGILHRDLKPANVLLTDEGQPMLLDFSLAQDVKRDYSAAAACIGGTLPYMAPEHLAAFRDGDRQLDARCDLYSLGVLLFEMLTGKHPFPQHRGSADEVLPRILSDRLRTPPRLRTLNPAVSPATEAIVRRLLEPDVQRRYQTARELYADLECQFQAQPLRYISEPSLRERGQKFLRRHPHVTSWTTAGLAITLTLALGIAGYVWNRDRLNKLGALEDYNAFRLELSPACYSLTHGLAERDDLPAKIRRGEELLGRYQVLELPAWWEAGRVRALATSQRKALREDMSLVLFLLAQAALAQATDVTPEIERQQLLERARHLNEAAQSAAPEGRHRTAFQTLQAELADRLAGATGSRAADALSPRAEATAGDRLLLGVTQVRRGEFRSAVANLQEVIEHEPGNPIAWLTRGIARVKLGQHKEAIGDLNACIALAPGYATAWFWRARSRQELGEAAQAIRDYDEAIRLQPTWPQAYYNRALAHQGLRNFAQASADLTRALEMKFVPTRCLLLRARLRSLLGDQEGAQADERLGLSTLPADEESWVARGVVRLATDPAAALADCDQALKLNPQSLSALRNKAHILGERLGRTNEALAVLDRAVQLHPDHAPFHAGRGVLLARLGKRAEAHREAEETAQRDSGAQLTFLRASIFALTARQEPSDLPEALRLLALAWCQGYGLEQFSRDSDFDGLRSHPDCVKLWDAARILQIRGR